jgi:hypothetical protein
LAPGVPVFLAEDTPSAVTNAYEVIALREIAERLAERLGSVPAPAPTRVDEQLDGKKVEGAPEQGSLPCESSQEFYDRLFAQDEIDATVAFGYIDEHPDSIFGYVYYSLLKWAPIPVFLKGQKDFFEATRSLFINRGFAENSKAKTELDLSRRFTYRGRLKTLRVHVIFSIARCPDEAPDEHGRLWRLDDQTCPEQQHATARAKSQFAAAFATSAVLVYNGHARLGRGLDFGPMGLDEGKLRLDCRSLPCASDATSQTLLFLNACDTAPLYGAAAARLRQDLSPTRRIAWLANRGDGAFGDAPQATVRLIEMLIEAKCPSDILTVMNLHGADSKSKARLEAEGF